MDFNKHSQLSGLHAFLSPSKYHWINYNDEKLAYSYETQLAAQKGTELHDLASKLIKHRQRLPRGKRTLNMYVNDAIGFDMIPEQPLFYSINAFGTADAISFRDYKLRIHDLKTGVNPTSIKQLFVYAAFFCLEYGFRPMEIETELRIYQNDEVQVVVPEPDEIVRIMNVTISHDKMIEAMKELSR